MIRGARMPEWDTDTFNPRAFGGAWIRFRGTAEWLVFITAIINPPNVFIMALVAAIDAITMVPNADKLIYRNVPLPVIVRKPDTICRTDVRATEVLQLETVCLIVAPADTHTQTAGVR